MSSDPVPVLLRALLAMAKAAPAGPRQQSRKEARARTNDDVRRVRQRMDETETRLENLEGRLRGHDLRLQYLEAPLKLLLKKFKAPVEFWAAKDAGFQAAKSAFSAAFLEELRDADGPLSNTCWTKLNQSLLSWILTLLLVSFARVILRRIMMGLSSLTLF